MSESKQPINTMPAGEALLRAMGVDVEVLRTASVPQWIVDLPKLAEQFNQVVIQISRRFEAYLKDIERRYERTAVRQALERRRQWKTSDVEKLSKLPRHRISARRLQALRVAKLRGRPVVQPYEPLPLALGNVAKVMTTIFSPQTPPQERLKLFKKTRFWPWFVDAVYRGCLAEAHARKEKGASCAAEEEAAERLVISTAQLRRLRNLVRERHRLERTELGRAISPDEFEQWKRSGDLPT